VKPLSPILAYLDPSAGSMLLQVLLGGSAALLVILKLCWRRFRDLLALQKQKASKDLS
jgi:hypothetical protein